jgi:Bacterial Ig-like domain (group 3)
LELVLSFELAQHHAHGREHSSLFRRRALKRLGACIILGCFCLCQGQVNVLTYHNDNARTGQNLAESILTPSNVQAATFGKLFTLSVDGKVDAQPLYVSALNIPGKGTHNVVYAATEHDSVYAFDADNGTIYWQVSLFKSGETPSDNRSCGQVTPEIGITATPVIDLTSGPNGTIYIVAMSKDGSGNYYQRLHALDITTGAEEFQGPVDVTGTYPGSGDNSRAGAVTFDPKQYKSRPGMLLLDGLVYIGWSSHCDIRPYNGWLMGYDKSSLQQRSILNFAPNGEGASLWGAGGGIAADSENNIFVQLANGTFETSLDSRGFPSSSDFGNAFARLATSGSQLHVVDYWTMSNTVSESSRDVDLGSGSLVLLPDLTDATGTVRHLGTGAGKDRNIYVFDRDNMGKFNAENNNSLYQELPAGLGGPEFAAPVWFNGKIYYGAAGDVIRAFDVRAASLSSAPSSTTSPSHTFPSPGVTPSISASGASNGILWAVENSSPAVLHAYDASNLATELYASNQAASSRDQFGDGNKWVAPMVANGKVFVGTTSGVAVFGLLAGAQATIGPANVSFGAQAIGVPSAPISITVMNTGRSALNVTAMAVSGANSSDFSATNTCGSPVPSGLNCAVSIKFQPSAGGVRTALLSLTDDAANSPQSIALSGFALPATNTNAADTWATTSSGTQTLTLAANVTSSAGILEGGTVTFTVMNGTTQVGSSATSGPVSNGRASASYTLPANTPAGTYSIQASFSGTGTLPASSDNGRTLTIVPVDPASGPLLFVPITPCRVVDTRNANGPSGGPKLSGDSIRDFPIASSCFRPSVSQIAAYALNVTVVPDSKLNYLTVWQAGAAKPAVSTLNSDGRIKANAAIVSAGTNGNVNVYATDPTHVILDVNGYFVPAGSPAGLAFYPLAPCRILDTRSGAGVLAGPALNAGVVRSFPVLSSSCNIPSDAQAYSLNLTAVPQTTLSYLAVWPTGQPQPLASVLNSPTGAVTANAALTPAGNNGEISFAATDNTDLIIDINGYFAAPGSGLSLYLSPPCRLWDTRTAGAGQAFSGTLPVRVTGSDCRLPATAQAAVFNATVVPSGAFPYLTLWPDGQPQPLVSTLNAYDGAVTSNMAISSVLNGYINAFGASPTQLILDIASYFAR